MTIEGEDGKNPVVNVDIREQGVEIEITGDGVGQMGHKVLGAGVEAIKRLFIQHIVSMLKEFMELEGVKDVAAVMLANFSEKGSRFHSQLKRQKTLTVESTTPALDVSALLLLGILYCKSSAKTRSNALLSLLNPTSAPMMQQPVPGSSLASLGYLSTVYAIRHYNQNSAKKIRPAGDLGLFSWEGELEAFESWLETDFSDHVLNEAVGEGTREADIVARKLISSGALRVESCRKMVMELFI